MTALTVGGVAIPVAASSPGKRDRLDMVDRRRAFDGTYRASQTGTPKREWAFQTPPITRDDANIYDAVLSGVVPQICAGDLLGNFQNLVTFSEQLDQWTLSGGTVTVDYAPAPAPNGTITADGFNPPGGGYYAKSNLISGDANGRTFTASAWLQIVSGVKTVRVGVVNQVDVPIIALDVIATSVWQRFRATGTVSSATTGFRMLLQESDGNSVGWLNWGMQLQESATLGDYVKTTSSPASSNSVNCFPLITGWTPVIVRGAHRVVLSFSLFEA